MLLIYHFVFGSFECLALPYVTVATVGGKVSRTGVKATNRTWAHC